MRSSNNQISTALNNSFIQDDWLVYVASQYVAGVEINAKNIAEIEEALSKDIPDANITDPRSHNYGEVYLMLGIYNTLYNRYDHALNVLEKCDAYLHSDSLPRYRAKNYLALTYFCLALNESDKNVQASHYNRAKMSAEEVLNKFKNDSQIEPEIAKLIAFAQVIIKKSKYISLGRIQAKDTLNNLAVNNEVARVNAQIQNYKNYLKSEKEIKGSKEKSSINQATPLISSGKFDGFYDNLNFSSKYGSTDQTVVDNSNEKIPRYDYHKI